MIGKWIYYQDGEYEKHGEIVLAVGVNHFLIKMHAHDGPSFSELWSVEGLGDALIFDNKNALDEFLAWASKDDRPNLRLVRTPSDKEPA